MATTPDEIQQQQSSRVDRIVSVVSSPVQDTQVRLRLAAMAAGAVASLAPSPFGPLAVALIVYVATDRRR